MSVRIVSKLLPVVALGAILGGCGLGEENVLFLTKTSIGLDVDAKPPTFDFGFDRKEGTVAPVFENGKVLPQMAGFSSDIGIINQAIGQSFATGTAAVLMSRYLTSNSRPADTGTIPDEELKDSSAIQTNDGKRKRYFFVTDTNFGLRVNFGLESGGIPDSLSMGYKRKELAFVPLIEGVDTNNKKTVALASLLATNGVGTDVSLPKNTKVVQTQFFATGLAASNLAALPEIRASVAPRIMPDAAKAISAKNAAALERGKKEGASLRVKIARVTEAVDNNGTVDTPKLKSLFNKTDIAANDSNRLALEGTTSTSVLETRLGVVNKDIVTKLAGQLD